jgi:pimeloyl-ACP methyl ester carboxylesterase
MIESYITTSDGVDIPYRLEGSPEPSAPLIVLSNSILTHHSIWDGFLTEFLSKYGIAKQYRFLRYLTRGRFSNCGNSQITVDVLAADIIALLDALRVEKAAALIGVSLGGATVLNAALTYPDRVGAFVACDTNSKSPEGNRKAWGDRIAVVANEGALGPSGEPIVGDQLADMTVGRWFVKKNLEDGNTRDLIRQVSRMVRENSLVGFQKSVEALFEYDLRDKMKESAARGAFLVGAGDGILPKTMKEMIGQMGPTANVELHVIDEAGHLPMVEQPGQFTQVIEHFLAHLSQ